MDEPMIMSSTWVVEQRDPDEWANHWGDAPEQLIWRRFGFSASTANDWFESLNALESKLLNAEEIAQVAAAWVVAGFEPDDAYDWYDPLPEVDPFQRPMLAREWRESGFTATDAAKWAAREDVTTAVLLENGRWHPRQRDLLDLLIMGDESASRSKLLGAPLPPTHVLDYVKAGLEVDEFAAYESLRRQGRTIDGVLRAAGELRGYPYWLAFRIDEVSAELPSESTGYHVEPLLSDSVDTKACEHLSDLALPMDYAWPQIIDLWSDRGLPVWTRGAGEWMTGGIPSDYAYEPILGWSDADLEIVRTAFAAELEEGQSCEISWPPSAGLWTEGTAFERSLQGCGDHEDFEPACLDCPVPSAPPQVEPAEWRWYVDVTILEPSEDGREELDVASSHEHILTTLMDPRAVEYSESGSLR